MIEIMGNRSEATGWNRRWPLIVGLVVGLGLIAAPLAFQMFTRAPKGGTMITAFKPYMTEKTISDFQMDLGTIGVAVTEAKTQVSPQFEARTGLSAPPAAYQALLEQWPTINKDMSGMLSTMQSDIGDYQAVAALPPFPLFPWFFVAPGVFLVGISSWGLLRRSRGGSPRAPLIALVVFGVGILAAPAIFQMFTRAPKGGQMIDDFASLMTPAKVGTVQGYFLVLADGEGTLRNQVVPGIEHTTGSTAEQLASALPSITGFSARWPAISSTMAPMIGAMSDNLGNYAAVKAMPPFPMFPWFFAIPGVIVISTSAAGLVLARRRSPAADVASESSDPQLSGQPDSNPTNDEEKR